MKTYRFITVALTALALASCNDYLDKLPDDRAELDTPEKIKLFNTSCYPQATNAYVLEMLSDNVGDYSRAYTAPTLSEELYRFKDVTDQGNDSPYMVWDHYYRAVASANQSLDAMDQEAYPALAAEAKLCRAFSMFQLANTFCHEWNPEKADQYLGLPYPLKPEQNVNTGYTRGTLRELYEAINKDIEEALPNVDDAIYTEAPKYHFNRNAAYAFAARFNLYYLNFNKAIQYADEVLGTGDPTSRMRNYEQYEPLGRGDIANLYVSSGEPANLMLTTPYTIAPYYLSYGGCQRFNHNYYIVAYETYWADMPWGSGSDGNTSYFANKMYGQNPFVAFPKFDPFFEYTDRVAGIGYYHGVEPVFTTDETLLVRCEAYALKGEGTFQKAVDDINYWITTHCKAQVKDTMRPVMTLETIDEFVESLDTAIVLLQTNSDRSIRKALCPQGFTVNAGRQDNLIQFILHLRRLETQATGMRFIDIKRYGIEFAHIVRGEDAVVYKPGDERGAVQLPQDVINAGLEPNPRPAIEK